MTLAGRYMGHRASWVVAALLLGLAAACGGAHHGAHGHSADQRFDDPEKWSKQFDDPQRDAWQMPDEVVRLMELAPGMTVADLGAGTGYFLGRLSAAVGADGRVLGLDVEPGMVRYMTERAASQAWANVQARLVDPSDPGLESASVDRVLIVNTWHHLPERVTYGQRLAAGLRPGGALYVVDFDKDSARGPARQHKLTAEDVIGELQAAGLAARVVAEPLPDQYIVVATLAN